jgi:hypothetical protein
MAGTVLASALLYGDEALRRCGRQLLGGDVPIRRLASGRAFGPDEVRAICEAFDHAWAALNEASGPAIDPKGATLAREKLARRIIDKAEAGTFDVEILRDDALAHLRHQPPSS